MNIVGPGLDDLTINAQDLGRAFVINSGVTATISGVTITEGNVTGTADGGGIHNSGTLTLDHVLMTANYAADSGGAIYNAGDLTIINSTIDNNDAGRGAGIYHTGDSSASMAIIASAIINNATYNSGSGGNRGGGLFINSTGASSTTASIVNSTLSGNTSNIGGGVFTNGAPTIEFINSTITANTGWQQGGGISVAGSTSPLITLHNTILADNTAGNGNTRNIVGTLQSNSSYNLIGVGDSGGLTNGVNWNIVLTSGTAGLTALGNYGGPTKTHALLDGSPAIDAGDGATAIDFDLMTDQRGKDRIDDGDDDLLRFADIGAFELAADEYFGTI